MMTMMVSNLLAAISYVCVNIDNPLDVTNAKYVSIYLCPL